VIEVLLKFLGLINVSEAVPESRRAKSVMSIVVFSELHVKGSHEKFVLKSDEGIRILFLHDV
jgi:hypothetical protein